jgi:hypothetical protein
LRESRCFLVFAIASCLLIGAISSTAQGVALQAVSRLKPQQTFHRGRGFLTEATHIWFSTNHNSKPGKKYRTMVADTAVSVTDKEQKPILGVISWRADTITNVSAQTVYVYNIQVLDARFLR